MTRVRNDLFDAKEGLNRGRPLWVEALWYLCKIVFFLSAFPWPSSVKRAILRGFGAEVGRGVKIKPRVNVLFPWKLCIGENAWIGEESWILNFEQVAIGNHCCISQRAFLCAGNHDYRRVDMRYRNAPIVIADGVWIGAQTFIGPGVVIHEDVVVTAGSIATTDLPAGMVCSGAPCRPVKARWRDENQPPCLQISEREKAHGS